jgi:hypothetical protein
MKKSSLLLYIAFIFTGLHSQSSHFTAGYGNFEAFNIGMRHEMKRVIWRYGYGNDLNLFGQGYYNCVYGSIGRPLLKEQLNTRNIISLHGRVLVWNIENKSNIFSAVSFSPQLQYQRKLRNNFSLDVYAGYVYSSVFRYKRKGYYEIGWPREWMPDFGVSVNYCLTCE